MSQLNKRLPALNKCEDKGRIQLGMRQIRSLSIVLVVLALRFLQCDAFTPSKVFGPPATHIISTCRRELRRPSLASIKLMAASVTDAEFKNVVLDSPVLTLVVFWASWCGPCRMLKPVLEEIETEYNGKVKVVQINTDENQQVATKYGVRSIPTTMLFKGGERLELAIGAVPKTTLEAMLTKRL